LRSTRKLLRFIRPYWLWALLAPLSMILEVLMDLLQPRLVQQIIDEGILRSDMRTVTHTGLLMVVVAVVGLAGGMACTVFAFLASMGMGADLRAELFRRVQSFSFGNLDRLESGNLITRLTNDVTQIQDVVMMMLRMLWRAPIMLVGGIVMAVITSPRLSLMFLVIMPVLLAVMAVLLRMGYSLFSRVQAMLDRINTVLQENLAGIRLIRAFARRDFEINRFREVNEGFAQANISAIRLISFGMPFMMLMLNGGIVAVVWFGGRWAIGGSLQVGQLVAFVSYLVQSLMSLMMVSMLIVRLSRAEASADRISEVLDERPDLAVATSPVRDVEVQGRVEFQHVTFSYDHSGGDPVLRDISFVAEPGQMIGIIGPTGSGKSTLVSLIPRFYDPTCGRVLLDGVDVREMDEELLRRSVGVALQEAVLFSGTIRDNIRFGRPEASDEEVEWAAKLAQAHDFIMSFPDGYDSVVGQRGVNLSGGQKQRLAIARALLVRPKVLVLDDSTSAVDAETESKIQAALRELRQTRFVVAQRISSVMPADKILVLEDGRIVAQGTHDELMQASPSYREIYESQMEHGAVVHDAA